MKQRFTEISDIEVYNAHYETQRMNEERSDTLGGSGLPTGPCQCPTCKRVRAKDAWRTTNSVASSSKLVDQSERILALRAELQEAEKALKQIERLALAEDQPELSEIDCHVKIAGIAQDALSRLKEPNSDHVTAETQNALSGDSLPDSALLDWLDTQKVEWHACWGGGSAPDSMTVWVDPSATWSINRIVENGTYNYPPELTRMTIRDAINAAMKEVSVLELNEEQIAPPVIPKDQKQVDHQ